MNEKNEYGEFQAPLGQSSKAWAIKSLRGLASEIDLEAHDMESTILAIASIAAELNVEYHGATDLSAIRGTNDFFDKLLGFDELLGQSIWATDK